MLELISKADRQLTPPALCRYLVDEVRRRTGRYTVAVLYAALPSHYNSIPGVQTWPVLAQYYSGPHPVICHPPCGPWGKLKGLCRYQVKELGNLAVAQAHLYGGVVEHPIGSSLFDEYGREGATLDMISQFDFGHLADKRTWLYWTV